MKHNGPVFSALLLLIGEGSAAQQPVNSGAAPLFDSCALVCTAQTYCYKQCWINCPGPDCEQITCGEWGVCNGIYCEDMVAWMRQTYSDAGSTHLKDAFSTSLSEWDSCNFSSGFYRVSSTNGTVHERFIYDANNIKITRESLGDCDHFRTHANFVWLKRCMAPTGESFVADCSNTLYEGSCSGTFQGSCSNTVILEEGGQLDLGGDLGTVSRSLRRTQVLSDGQKERYYYAKPFGFVKYELVNQSGQVTLTRLYNDKVAGQKKPNQSPCYTVECAGQACQ